jgi:hypothetical protein
MTCVTFLNFSVMLFLRMTNISRAPHDCYLLHMDTDSICGWCTSNYMKIKVGKARVISFTKKTNMIPLEYTLCGSCINRADTVKYLQIIFYNTLYFHHHVEYIF